MAQKGIKTSELLLRIAQEARERVSLAWLVEQLGDRGFGILLCLWALPCAIPIPGISTPFGLLIMVTSAQMAAGQHKPWLPAFVLKQTMERSAFRRMVDRAVPRIVRFERFCKPRLAVAARGPWERALGVFIFILGVVLTLPIWGGNLLPALAIIIMALGLIEQDGLAVAAGVLIGILSEVVVASILGTAFFIFMKFMQTLGVGG
jgi:hypothetical protein